MSRHHVIYIPGLGDHRARGQMFAVKLWKMYGVASEVAPMHWRDSEPFTPKLKKLLTKIERYVAAGDAVSLVAASAGASAALAAYAERPSNIAGVVLICGKVRNPQNMHPSVFRKNPSFKDSMSTVDASLERLQVTDRARIMTIHPLADESVPVGDTNIESAQERTIPVIGHALGIGFSLMIYAPWLLAYLKGLAKTEFRL